MVNLLISALVGLNNSQVLLVLITTVLSDNIRINMVRVVVIVNNLIVTVIITIKGSMIANIGRDFATNNIPIVITKVVLNGNSVIIMVFLINNGTHSNFKSVAPDLLINNINAVVILVVNLGGALNSCGMGLLVIIDLVQ